MKVKLEIPIEPIPQPRARVTRNGTYQPSRIVKYKELVRQAGQAAMEGKPPITGQVSVRLKLYRKYKATSRRFGDCDNLYKAVTDALNGTIYVDDSQIVECHIQKLQSDKPKLEMEIIQGTVTE